MLGIRNVNHRNYFKTDNEDNQIKNMIDESEVVEVKEDSQPSESKISDSEDIQSSISKFDAFELTKSEQRDLLEKLGVSKSEIRKLRYEWQRVKRIRELYK